jgi:NAD(P)-dependent dehydrogenase (short-subunit alcohol dehydrogenase family)
MRLHTSLGIAIGTALGTFAAARALRARRAIDLDGATVVIFGGSRGLGLALAREFAVAEQAHVVLAARDDQELERAAADVEGLGGRVTTIQCDLRDRSQIDRTIQRILHDRGAIDVLVNNAGIIQVGPIEHMTVADFEEAMATHFWGPLHTTLAALPHMTARGAKRIVNISSIGGKIAVPHLLPYRRGFGPSWPRRASR